MAKHILVISQYFYPEPFRINDICQEWVKRGYRVTVLTGLPNYPKGKIYKGYGLFKKRKEIWNDIQIIRIPLIPRGHSAIKLVLNYYSFVISGWFWHLFTTLKPDLVFSFEVSPMTQVLVGKWFSKRRKIPHYAYIQDLWPDNLEIVGGIHNKMVLNHYRRMTNRIYNSCTKIFATSQSFVEEIQKCVPDKEKVLFWPQYAEGFCKPMEKTVIDEIPEDGRFKIIFTGNLGEAQGLEILPQAAKLVDESVCFVLVGDGRYKEQLIKLSEDVKEKFIFVDRKPAEMIPELLAACDVAFVSFMNNALFEKTIPAKLQTYLACGMPILASASGETAKIIENARCGYCCTPGDVSALANYIKALKQLDLSEMKKNSLDYSHNHFNREKLFDYMDSLLGDGNECLDGYFEKSKETLR